MGGCYNYSGRSSSCRNTSTCDSWRNDLKKFVEKQNKELLIKSYKAYLSFGHKHGFFLELAKESGIENVSDIPNEFPKIEYEIKFNVIPYSDLDEEEPSVKEYLDAFDFPVGGNTRFLKDAVNQVATGVNNFYGDSQNEKLVVIEKCGGLYLKEKGLVVPTNAGVNLEEIVIKRTEDRYPAQLNEITEKVMQVSKQQGVKYRGKIRKEKGDAFILDTNDGRIYSMSFTRAHLIKPGTEEESKIQRQLELEYAGYIPGFLGFEENSEKQIVQGMVDLGKYTAFMFYDAPIANGWRMNARLTGERKYDFVAGINKNNSKETAMLSFFDMSQV